MARKEPDPPHELDPLKGGLKHNPLAALRAKIDVGALQSGPAEPMPASSSSKPSAVSAKTPPAPAKTPATDAKAPAANAVTSSASAKATAANAGSAASHARPTAATAKPAHTAQRITVRIERTGRGGKTVTIAEGPGLHGRKLEPLAKEIARGMGTGARVESSAIVVQGDQRERLVVWLGKQGFGGAVAGN